MGLQRSTSESRAASTISARPWLALVSRSFLFLFFQAIAAAGLALAGRESAWSASAPWWVLSVVPANLVSIYLLDRLLGMEGQRYLGLFRFPKSTWKRDLLWLLGVLLLAVPIVAAPMRPLAEALFGDDQAPIDMMFQRLPVWALALGLLFPITTGMAELPMYYGYAMPRLTALLRNGWMAWLIAGFFLAAQHVFLPFIPDMRFVLWRFGMFVPFALFAGLVIKLRPGLLPYMAIGHALIDISAWSVYLRP